MLSSVKRIVNHVFSTTVIKMTWYFVNVTMMDVGHQNLVMTLFLLWWKFHHTFSKKKVLNIFSKTSSGVIPPPTISARRKRHSRICWLYRISEIRTACPFSIRLKSIYNSNFSTKRKEVHLLVSRVKFTNKFINSYIHIWVTLNL